MPPNPTAAPSAPTLTARALQLGARLDLRGLERDDAFSKSPLGYMTASGGTVVLFKSGAAVLVAMPPDEEHALLTSLAQRVSEPLDTPETETAELIVRPDEEELVGPTGALQLRSADGDRIILVATALAMSASLSWDERRIQQAFERVLPLAEHLRRRSLPPGPHSALLEEIGEALTIQYRLASRTDLVDKPDLLWENARLERFWAKLVEEFDLAQRSRAIERRLEVIRDASDTLAELMATRTSHRLEWYIIALIAFEIALGLYDRIVG